MKNVKFVLCFLMGLSVFSCTNTTEDLKPNASKENAVDQPLFSEDGDGDLIEIGFFEGEEFHFTVSDDELQQVYAYNVENNLDQSGTFKAGNVVPSDEENDEYPYFVLLSGVLDDGGSAILSAEVIAKLDEESALLRILINPKPVLPGICYNFDCAQCRKADLTPTNLFCRCQSDFTITCPYYIDPTIVWTQ